MGLFQSEIRIVEKPKINKTNTIKLKYLNGYYAIKEKLDENNTLTVKQAVVVNGKTKSKVNIVLN